ncbi:MAG: ROK family protein [Acidobacteria bacterium]|nr:ROK family protein [Acidobacteriota bacterium]
MNTLAVDIGGTKFSMAVFSAGRAVARESRRTDRDGGRDWMLGQILEIAHEWMARIPVARCGVGFGGPVLFAEQRVALSTHVGGWSDFPLTAWLAGALKIPVLMDNDANVGALGESRHGAGQGANPMFYMTLSTGIGGGIIVDGKVVRGADSYAGEIGHISLDRSGPECLCGARGCFERLCCGLWLERDHGRPAHELLNDPGFTARYAVDLAAGLKACIMLLNPAVIVIGGGISKAGEKLFGPLRQELRRQVTAWSRARIEVQPASLGDDSVLYGAMELANELP